MIDAFDGSFLDEWQSDQDITRVITGQYDWINNKVWMGDLLSSAVYRYPGLGQVSRGQLTSVPVGPAARWDALSVMGSGPLLLDVLVAEGEEVQDGQALAVVEAMKMENTLRAEKKGTIAKINAAPGDNLAVDEIILEFAQPE